MSTKQHNSESVETLTLLNKTEGFNIDISEYEYPELKPREQDWRWCHKYAYDVVKGNIPSCKTLRQAAERHFRDLQNPDFYFDEKAASSVVLWFKFIPITDGIHAGKQTILLPWQIFIVVSLIAWLWADDVFEEVQDEMMQTRVKGTRRFNQFFGLVSRKAGKTTLAAGLKLYLMHKAGHRPRAFSLATKRDQAKEVWETACEMINLSPRLKQIFKVRANDILMPGKSGSYKPLASDSKSLDGLNPMTASLDECHAIKDRNLYGVIISAFGAQPEYLMIVITTAGFILDGLCTDIYKNGCRVLDPDDPVRQDNYFYAMFTMDKGDDWTEEQTWFKSNPGLIYGLPNMKYLRDRFSEASLSTEEKANFLTKHCNMFVSGSDKWLDMAEVKACPKPMGESYLDPIYKGRKVYVGLDRARVHDITSFCIMYPMDDGGIDCFYVNLLPKQTVDSVSDYLKAKYSKALETGDLQLVYTPTVKDVDIEKIIESINSEISPESWNYDPWHMRQICENMEDRGLTMVAVSQGTGNMSEPAKNLEGLIKEKLFRYNSVLFEYACECAMMTMTKKNNMDIWRENDKVDKIDPLISTIITLSGATLFKVETNIYDEREMISI
jgi:phage terminase large subunit-like protein